MNTSILRQVVAEPVEVLNDRRKGDMKKWGFVILLTVVLIFSSCSSKEKTETADKGYVSPQVEELYIERPKETEYEIVNYFKKLVAVIDRDNFIPAEVETKVYYSTGISYVKEGFWEYDGMTAYGVDKIDPSDLSDESYYYEFHVDSDGLLSHVVVNDNGKRSLVNRFYYYYKNRAINVYFENGKISYIDIAYLSDRGKLMYRCRMAPDGSVLFKKNIAIYN